MVIFDFFDLVGFAFCLMYGKIFYQFMRFIQVLQIHRGIFFIVGEISYRTSFFEANLAAILKGLDSICFA